MSLTESDHRALEAVVQVAERRSDGKFTCTELGEVLFDGPRRNRQCYARPAGKVLHRLEAMGYVESTTRKGSDGRVRGCYVRTRKPFPER